MKPVDGKPVFNENLLVWQDAIASQTVERVEESVAELTESVVALLDHLQTAVHTVSVSTKLYVDGYVNVLGEVEGSVEDSIQNMGALIKHCQDLNGRLAPIEKTSEQIKRVRNSVELLEAVLTKDRNKRVLEPRLRPSTVPGVAPAGSTASSQTHAHT
eukprot:Rmarinus@m.11584